MQVTDIKEKISSMAEASHAKSMEGFGIQAPKAFGVRIPKLRALAKEIGKNHALALELWEENYHEAKLLAIFLLEHKKLTEAQMESWVKDFYSWDLVDQACTIFSKHPQAMEKAHLWRHREPEFEKRAGIVLLVAMAVHHKKKPEEEFLPFFQAVKDAACDNRNFVKKAANWLLRQLGKRSLYLHPHALACGEKLLEMDCPAARWIAQDALRELRSEKVMERLLAKEARKKK